MRLHAKDFAEVASVVGDADGSHGGVQVKEVRVVGCVDMDSIGVVLNTHVLCVPPSKSHMQQLRCSSLPSLLEYKVLPRNGTDIERKERGLPVDGKETPFPDDVCGKRKRRDARIAYRISSLVGNEGVGQVGIVVDAKKGGIVNNFFDGNVAVVHCEFWRRILLLQFHHSIQGSRLKVIHR